MVLLMATILLSDLVDEFVDSLRANAYSKNTIRNHERAARYLLLHVGNIQARSVTPKHIDSYFAKRKSEKLGAGSLNVELVGLRALFRHAVQRRYIAAGTEPTAHRRPFREVPRDRLRIPAAEFPRLLEAAEHPRDRIVVALGIYLFLRQSEVRELRVRDVDLTHLTLTVRIQKTRELDYMPISEELERELRAWLTYYASHLDRELDGDDYLVPSKTPPLFLPGLDPRDNWARAKMQAKLNPSKPIHKPELAVQRALAAFGMPLRGDDGRSLSEGVHTLRRSGARALFDQLVSEGYDGAMRTVQSMLHHKSVTTTERYLGVGLDAQRRDDVVRGKAMFPVAEKNVLRMENRRGDKADIREAV